MLYSLIRPDEKSWYFVIGLIGFALTVFSIKTFARLLPRDQGRPNAVNGELSKGKPRGAGIILISVFTLATALFVPLSIEMVLYLVFIYASMLTGFLDDSAKMPWGPVKKGLLDLAIAVGTSLTYYIFNGSKINLGLFGISFTINKFLFVVLGAVLVWGAINVTNCSDGVDGLCASLCIVSFGSIFILSKIFGTDSNFLMLIATLIICIVGYLWFNCSPSQLLMGDAGSRALGVAIAVACLKSTAPLMFIPLCIVLIIDGGAGLIKLGVRRAFKLMKFMEGLRTPVHDHFRKTKNFAWSDTQVVIRFCIVQIVVSTAFLAIAK